MIEESVGSGPNSKGASASNEMPAAQLAADVKIKIPYCSSFRVLKLILSATVLTAVVIPYTLPGALSMVEQGLCYFFAGGENDIKAVIPACLSELFASPFIATPIILYVVFNAYFNAFFQLKNIYFGFRACFSQREGVRSTHNRATLLTLSFVMPILCFPTGGLAAITNVRGLFLLSTILNRPLSRALIAVPIVVSWSVTVLGNACWYIKHLPRYMPVLTGFFADCLHRRYPFPVKEGVDLTAAQKRIRIGCISLFFFSYQALLYCSFYTAYFSIGWVTSQRVIRELFCNGFQLVESVGNQTGNHTFIQAYQSYFEQDPVPMSWVVLPGLVSLVLHTLIAECQLIAFLLSIFSSSESSRGSRICCDVALFVGVVLILCLPGLGQIIGSKTDLDAVFMFDLISWGVVQTLNNFLKIKEASQPVFKGVCKIAEKNSLRVTDRGHLAEPLLLN